MRAGIDLQQARRVDSGVNLRGRKRGVAKQLLNSPEITSACQQMRRERMAQRMRRSGVGQSEHAAQAGHRQLNDAGRERTAARANEQRAFLSELERTQREIVINGFRHLRQDRDHSLLPALSRYNEGFSIGWRVSAL